MAKKWNVWSVDRNKGRGLVVDEGTETQAREGAERRNVSAARYQMDVVFVAKPDGQVPVAEDLPPVPPEPQQKPGTRVSGLVVRNENPLHTHAGEQDLEWDAKTLKAHLQVMHGVDSELADSLPGLHEIHDALRHGPEVITPAQRAALDELKTAHEAIYREAVYPERRYARIAQADCHWHPSAGNPGHVALEFLSTNDRDITAVCMEPGDLAELRAAVTPDSEGLRALQDVWRHNLGPGGSRAVEAGHAAGYKLAVQDLTGLPQDLPTRAEVREYLQNLLEDRQPAPVAHSLRIVLALLEDGEPV
jgi:hypothetical protein